MGDWQLQGHSHALLRDSCRPFQASHCGADITAHGCAKHAPPACTSPAEMCRPRLLWVQVPEALQSASESGQDVVKLRLQRSFLEQYSTEEHKVREGASWLAVHYMGGPGSLGCALWVGSCRKAALGERL
jgi:hypothetical protein